MNTAAIVDNIEFLVAIVAFIWFFYGPWQSLVVDVLRQNLFQLRDDLFSEAAKGKWSFESRQYHLVRGRFNAMIRYAHTAKWSHVLAMYCVKPKQVPEFNIQEISSNIEDREVARKVCDYYYKALFFIMLSIVTRSFVLVVLNMALAPFIFIILFADAKKTERKLARVGSAIEQDVEVEEARCAVAA
jgi:hypothetical protein